MEDGKGAKGRGRPLELEVVLDCGQRGLAIGSPINPHQRPTCLRSFAARHSDRLDTEHPIRSSAASSLLGSSYLLFLVGLSYSAI